MILIHGLMVLLTLQVITQQQCSLTASGGCDSLVTLDLTIGNSNTGTDTQTSCDTYTPGLMETPTRQVTTVRLGS